MSSDEVKKQSADPKELHEPSSKDTLAPMIKTMDEYKKFHILVNAEVKIGFCLFYSVIKAQKRHHWGNEFWTLGELKRRMYIGAQQNKNS